MTILRKKRISWWVKLPLILVIFATLPLATFATVAIDFFADTSEKNTLKALAGLASAKQEAIDQFTANRQAEAERIAQLIAPPLHDLLAESPRTEPGTEGLPSLEDAEQTAKEEDAPPPARKEPPQSPAYEDALSDLRRAIGLILWDQQQFEEILVIGDDGRVIASTFAVHENRVASDLAYFQNGLRATSVAPVFVSPITGRLTMVISTPIHDRDRRVVGVLAARLNLSRFFRLVNDVTGLGSTGETAIGKIIDEQVVFMAPTRHDAEAALTRKLSVEDVHRPIIDAARGLQGAGRAVDYRGRCVYAAWEHVPTLEWGLVVKMDCDEAMQPVVTARNSYFLLGLIIIFIALVASVAVARMLVRPLRQLKAATDRISRGDFEVGVDIPPGDEIGDLADSFERMVVAIRFFRARSHGEEEPEEEDKPSE